MRILVLCAFAMICGCSHDEVEGPPVIVPRRSTQPYTGPTDQQKAKWAAQREADEAEERERNTAKAEEKQLEEQVKAKAIALGYSAVNFGNSLTTVLELIKRGEMPLDVAQKVVINLGDKDDYFAVLQVIDQNNVLFQHQHSEFILWLKNYKKKGGSITWLEGAHLRSMDYNYVAIKGVKAYGTLIGSRQAIVIEPVF